jgi:uncharacterized protein YkwD
MEAQLLQLVNKERAKLNLAPLTICPKLGKAARTHTVNMANSGVLSHDDADGHFARERIKDAGYGAFLMLGENLAMNGGFRNPVEMAVQGWMKSEGHRVNVIDPQYTQTGVGVVEKNGKVYFTQVYALPASVSG